MSMNELTNTAYHEAGHAVMHIVRSIPIDYVTIVPNDDYKGAVRWNHGPSVMLNMNMGNNSREIRSLAIDAILISLAGPVAEEKFAGLYDKNGSADDLFHADEIAMHYSRNPEKYIKAKFAETRKVISRNWRLVGRVAEALLEHKTLDHDTLLEIAETEGIMQ